jgi:EpsI family protein
MALSKIQIVAIVILAVSAAMGNYLRLSDPPVAAPLQIANAMAGVEAYAEEHLEQDFLDVLQAESAVFRTYEPEAPAPVWVFLGYFNQQKEGSQVHSPRHCYPGSGWSIVEEGKTGPGWSNDVLTTLVVSDGNEERLVWYWFQTPNGILNDVFDLKLYLTKNAILRRPQEVVFVRVSTLLQGDHAAAGKRLGRYADDLHSDIADLYTSRDQ